MTLEEKIAQMFIINFDGFTYTKELKDIITCFPPGGIILFQRNLTTKENTINLISSMQQDSKIPLFVSIDEEGGRIQELKGIKDFPALEDLGKAENEELSYQTGKEISSLLKQFHFNMDFAPVIDINSNPNNHIIGNRAFGTTSEIVEKMSIPFAKGIKEQGIIPVYKHFPGHGDTFVDSHIDLPIVNKTKEELLSFELKPFIKAIQEDADAIMLAHLAIPKLTGNKIAASLSKEVVTDLLRKELGFSHLIILDGITMNALENYKTEEENTILAILAGVDLILMPSDLKQSIEWVKKKIAEGIITEQRIDESVERILNIKKKYHLFSNER